MTAIARLVCNVCQSRMSAWVSAFHFTTAAWISSHAWPAIPSRVVASRDSDAAIQSTRLVSMTLVMTAIPSRGVLIAQAFAAAKASRARILPRPISASATARSVIQSGTDATSTMMKIVQRSAPVTRSTPELSCRPLLQHRACRMYICRAFVLSVEPLCCHL